MKHHPELKEVEQFIEKTKRICVRIFLIGLAVLIWSIAYSYG